MKIDLCNDLKWLQQFIYLNKELLQIQLIKKINVDNTNQTITLEIGKGDLEKIVGSVKHMVNKQQRTLLDNLPPSDLDRKNLDEYKALAENLRKIWELW